MATQQLIHDDRYLRYIFFSLIYLGAIIILLVPSSSYFGYTIVAAGLFMIILVFFEYIIHSSVRNSSSSNFSKLTSFLYALVSDGTPVFMVFGIVIYLLAITMAYNSNIIAGDVTPQYVNFRNISAIFLIIEAVMLNTYLGEKRKAFVAEEKLQNGNGNGNGNGTKSFGARAMKVLSKDVGLGLLITLFATLHILVVIIIDMNLRYFTTEGFKDKSMKERKEKERKEKERKEKERKEKERKERKENLRN